MEETENQEVKRGKAAFMQRFKGKYPQVNEEDEDGVYDRINADYDEYEGAINRGRENEQGLLNLFSSDPRAASFLTSWAKGENPVVQLMRQYGGEFKEALDDPELQEQLVAAQAEYMQKQAKNQELQEASAQNLGRSLDALDAAVAEAGYSDDDADKAFELFLEILEKGIVNDVSKETWLMFLKALNHDKDVETAAHEAEVRGRNAKIDKEKKKKTMPQSMPPTLNGSRGARDSSTERKPLGALDRATSDNDIWERGKARR